MNMLKGICALTLAGTLVLPSTAALAQTGIHDDSLVATATPQAPSITRGGGTIMLDFEGLGNQEAVLEFYNGGTGGNGSGPGTNFGISFSPNSLAIIDADAGGTGNFGGEPSPDTILFFLTGGAGGTAATMNVPAGFEVGFSFYYSAINNPGIVRVYDGLNATGNVLATLNLPLTPANGAPDPTGNFSPLVPIGVTFTGVARSVDFGGTVNQVGFDNITLGSGTPIGGPGGPEPRPYVPVPSGSLSSVLILSILLGLVALVAIRRH